MENKIIHDVNITGITVHNLDSSSGIFVGINNANYWTSQLKANQGFGPLSSSQAIQNINVVVDNDGIDAPIENNVQIPNRQDFNGVDVKKADEAALVNNHNIIQEIKNIDVDAINVFSMDTNAAISVGENVLDGWSAHSKRNEGTGRSMGITEQILNTNIIMDQDIIDAQMNDVKITK
ncbi:hypothetical protein [Neobacillus mesonae]|uniref:hypothetical protein n=1 Tax=Neobacillus mesonae TaxID=1193713 RepID=UPI0025744389|nr:hypothetical protein [Neobacillus mesonae]MED4205318.1 hypothetical protein [Neobacillus mesonae]